MVEPPSVEALLSLDPDAMDPAALKAVLAATRSALLAAKVSEEAAGVDSAPLGLRPPFSLDTLAAMLRREDGLRLAPETQAAYAAAELREDTSWMEVTDELQKQVRCSRDILK